MTPGQIQEFISLIAKHSGNVLDESKAYLLEHRLSEVVANKGLAGYDELLQRAACGEAALVTEIIDAITTNETLFFRDANPFVALSTKVLPHMIDQLGGRQRLRIWSAASSTGQEPYSIAMALHEMFEGMGGWDISIVGTDISNTAISQASRGRYSAHEVTRGVDDQRLAKYFRTDGDSYVICDEIRSMVSFQRRNLDEPIDDLGQFDVIFCRNVAIYFDEQGQDRLFTKVYDALMPCGALFIGAMEALPKIDREVVCHRHCRAVIYAKPGLCLGDIKAERVA